MNTRDQLIKIAISLSKLKENRKLEKSIVAENVKRYGPLTGNVLGKIHNFSAALGTDYIGHSSLSSKTQDIHKKKLEKRLAELRRK